MWNSLARSLLVTCLIHDRWLSPWNYLAGISVAMAGTSVELVRHGKVQNCFRSLADGADRRDAALPHHGRRHVGSRMQAVRRYWLGIELACEVERKHDLGELALGIGARAAVTARQHEIIEVNRVLAQRRDVHDAGRLAEHHEGQQNSGE